MIYILEGHDLRHAAEEMILHLLPATETAQMQEKPETGEYCISRLRLQETMAYAEAEVRIGNSVRTAARQSEIDTEESLARKRVLTEIVKLSIFDAIAPTLSVQPEWGSLTGVRPAKLARGMMERGLSRGETAQLFREKYKVSAARTALTMRAAAHAQEALRTLPDHTVSLYVGIPFCPSRCAYCSFVSQSIEKSSLLIPPYLDALCEEIAQTGELMRQAGRQLSSIYIGGGTPTTLSAEQLLRLMGTIEKAFDLSQLCEYTVEAGRPDTITPEKMQAIRQGGADRVSINPQTMNDAILRNIGRRHSADDVLKAYEIARAAGFDVINMDTIAGLEGDTLDSFAHTIDTLIALKPENITVHTLAIKRGADLSDKAGNAARYSGVKQMIAYANDALSTAGYGPYYLYRQKFTAGGFENVGWCKPSTESLYNIAMMEEIQTILSAGAGAVSKRVDRASGRITRFVGPKYPKEYMESVARCVEGKRRLLLEK